MSNELGDPGALAPPHRSSSSFSDPAAGGGGGKDDDGDEKRGGQSVKYLNLMYDVTPIKFVGMVVTEVGMIPPTAIPALLREYRREAGGGPLQQSDM